MIGLGSNRLTVCRRGGMSVTQAGRGGMEWLAGGRLPSWATPYSAQATAALRAQFPTQWPTIRDYGFAHPALVPFINEDPMLVMSLIEGLGTRWLIGDGTAYIDMNRIIARDDVFHIHILSNTGYQQATIFGSTGSSVGLYIQNWREKLGVNNSSEYSTSSANVEYDIVCNPTKWILDGTTENNYGRARSDSPTTSGLFCFMYNGSFTQIWKGGISVAECTTTGREFRYVPCKHKVNGVLKAGMLDLVNLVWYGNANSSGSFTISETPAS